MSITRPPRSVHILSCSAALLGLFCVLLASSAEAAIRTWSPVNTNFNDGANWLGGLPGSADIGVFPGAAGTQPNVTAPISVFGLSLPVGSSGYIISSSGSPITLLSTVATSGSSAVANAAAAGTTTFNTGLVLGAAAGSTQTFSFASGGTTVFNNAISGGDSTSTFSISGNGVAIFNAANTYSSTTALSGAGAVIIGNKSAFGTNTVAINASKPLTAGADLTGANAIANNLAVNSSFAVGTSAFGIEFAGNVNLGGAGRTISVFTNPNGVIFSGTIGNDGGAGLTFNRGDASGIATLKGENTYTGVTSVQGVALSVSHIGNAGSASNLGTSGTISLGGAASSQATRLVYTGTGETTDKVFHLNSGNGGITLDTTGATGALVITSNFTATSGGTGKVLTLTGANTGNTISGNIPDALGGGNVGVTKSGSGSWILSGSNTYTGTTTVSAGVLQFNSPNSIGGSGRTLIVSTGATAAAGYAIDQAFVDRVTVGSAGSVALGANSSNNISFVGITGALYLGSIGDFTYSGSLTPATTVYRLGGGGGNLTVSSVIGGANTMFIGGPGRVILTAANTYSGATTLVGGSILQGKDTTDYVGNATVNTVFGSNIISPGTGTSNLELRANGLGNASAQTLTFVNGIQASTGGQVLNVDVDRASGIGTGKTIAVGLLNLATPASGTTTLNVTGSNGYRLMASGAAALTLGGAGTSGSVLLNPTTASLVLNGNVTNSGGGSGVYTKTLILGGTSTGNVVTGTITNGVSATGLTTVTKAGSSTWTLNGTSTYTGATDVTAGTLLINGALGNTTVTVSGSAVLGGSGTIGGALNVTGNSFLSPGNSPGTLTANNDVTLSGNSTLVMELSGTSAGQFDKLVINGAGNDFTLSGSDVTLSLVLGYTPQIGDSFTLVDITGSGVFTGVFDNLTPNGTITVGATQFTANNFGASNDLILTVSAIPEPQTLMLSGIGFTLALYGYRRRRS